MENFNNNEVSQQFNLTEKDRAMVYGQYQAENYEQYIHNVRLEHEELERKNQARTLAEKIGKNGRSFKDLTNVKPTATEVIRSMNMDFLPEKKELQILGQDGYKTLPEHFAITNPNNDKVYSVAKGQYTPANYIDLAPIFDENEITPTVAMVIRDGGKFYIEGDASIEGEVTPGDTVKQFLCAYSSHDGSASLAFAFKTERLACANQLSFIMGAGTNTAVKNKRAMKIRHTKSIEQLTKLIPSVVDFQKGVFLQDLEGLKAMQKKQLNSFDFTQLMENTIKTIYADRLQGEKKLRNGSTRKKGLEDIQSEIIQINDNLRNEKINGKFERSVYNVFNAITRFETHQSGRSKDIEKRNIARLESLYGGPAHKKIETCREYLLAQV